MGNVLKNDRHRLRRGLIALVVAVCAVFTVVVVPAHADDGTTRINMSIETPESIQGKPKVLEYWSGATIPAIASFTSSGSQLNLPDATVTIAVPKSPYLAGRPSFVDSDQAQSSSAREDAQYYYYDYKFSAIRGGMTFDLPFRFAFANRRTPNGTTITPTWTLTDSNGNVVASAQETFTAKASSTYTMDKYGTCDGASSTASTVACNNPTSTNGKYDYVYRWDVDTATASTPADGIAVQYALAVSPQKDANAPTDQGEYFPDQLPVRLVDQLPAEAELHPDSVAEGWVYDATSHTATWEGNLERDAPCAVMVSELPQNGKTTPCKTIKLLYKNAPVNEDGKAKTYTNSATATIQPGTEKETHSGPSTLNISFAPSMYKKSTFGVTKYVGYANDPARADGRSKTYVLENNELTGSDVTTDSFSIDNPGSSALRWVLRITQTNNGGSTEQPKTGGIHSMLKYVEDSDLDSSLYYQRVRITGVAPLTDNASLSTQEITDRFNATHNTLYGIQSNGTKVQIAQDLNVGSAIDINDSSRRYSGFQIQFDTPLEMDNFSIDIGVDTLPTAELLGQLRDGSVSDNQRSNSTNVVARNTGSDKDISSGSSASIILKKPVLRMYGTAQQSATVPYTDCAAQNLTGQNCPRVRPFLSNLLITGSWGPRDVTVKNLRFVILLPLGVEYSSTGNIQIFDGIDAPHKQDKPDIVSNYQNTGRTALIYSFGDVTVTPPTPLVTRRVATVQYYVDTTLYANDGKNYIDWYPVWDNTSTISPSNIDDRKKPVTYGTLDDTLSLEGDTTTQYQHLQHVIDFVSPQEIISRKTVSLDGKVWSFTAPPADLPATLYYKVELRNASLRPVQAGLTLVDVLPHTNDHAIAPNGQGEYQPRSWQKTNEDGTTTIMKHSGFSTPLTGPIQSATAILNGTETDATERFDFYYATTPQGVGIDSVINANWMKAESITDWSQVTMFKAILKTGYSIASKESIAFVTKNEIPWTDATKTMDSDVRAMNSTAFATDGQHFTESNNATTEIIRYQVNGIVFTDRNNDGNFNQGDTRSANIPVSLVDAETGEPVLNPDGTAVAGITDDDGAYHLTVYKRGKYRVRFELPTNRAFTTIGDGTDTVANHVGVCSPSTETLAPNSGSAAECSAGTARVGWTDIFALTPEHRSATRNAGLILDYQIPSIPALPLTGGWGSDFFLIAGAIVLAIGGLSESVRKIRRRNQTR